MELWGDDVHLVVSEGILGDGKFGVYVVSDEEPGLEYSLITGIPSLDQARARAAQTLKSNLGKDIEPRDIPYRVRPGIEVDSMLRGVDELSIKEAVKSHVQQGLDSIAKVPTLKGWLKGLASSQALPWLLCAVALILFWKGISVTIPKDLALPLLGNLLAGYKLEASKLARYFPLLLLAAYAARAV